MGLVPHKYMPEEMPEEELKATFAAREHTLDYLTNSLRDQSRARTLTSYLITGPRGSGKTTIVLMLCLRLREDPELGAAWLPVRFPEELRGVSSLRDVLAAALERLAADGVPGAREAHAAAQAEGDDGRSQELSIGALRRIAQQQGRRLVLFVENLDQVFDRALDAQGEATLRRLLMTDPFMMVVGTAVRIFPALARYDKALFNYFCPVPLARLDDDQVRRLLQRRAEYEGRQDFDALYEAESGKIGAISRLTGGNPRLVMELYEVLGHGSFDSATARLQRLIDELTPLLKDILDHQLSGQQGHLVDALMRSGGTATPAQIASATRLPINTVTRQLQRLKEMQFLEVRGGGKGRPAHYTVPDQLFCTWYQMRYLRPQRRRIELFVEVLTIWLDEQQRMARLRSLAGLAQAMDRAQALDAARAVDYFGASLVRTPFAHEAQDLMVGTWMRQGRYDEAAAVLAEAAPVGTSSPPQPGADPLVGLIYWALDRQDLDAALGALRSAPAGAPEAAAAAGQLAQALNDRGILKGREGKLSESIADFTTAIELPGAPAEQVAGALANRGVSKGQQGDTAGGIADYTAAIEMSGASAKTVALALFSRGVLKEQQGDMAGAITDYTAAIVLPGAPAEPVAIALFNRGVRKGQQGDTAGEITDYTAVIELPGAPAKQVARALFYRGVRKGQQGDTAGEIADCTAAIELPGAPAEQVAGALVNRGASKGKQGDMAGAITDFTAAIEVPRAPVEVLTAAVEGIARVTAGTGIAFASAAKAVARIPVHERARVLVRAFESLAQPELRHSWPAIVHGLVAAQEPDTAEQLAVFLAIANALEAGDPSRLDPLPPEQRSFGLEVLRRFEVTDATGGGTPRP